LTTTQNDNTEAIRLVQLITMKLLFLQRESLNHQNTTGGRSQQRLLLVKSCHSHSNLITNVENNEQSIQTWRCGRLHIYGITLLANVVTKAMYWAILTSHQTNISCYRSI